VLFLFFSLCEVSSKLTLALKSQCIPVSLAIKNKNSKALHLLGLSQSFLRLKRKVQLISKIQIFLRRTKLITWSKIEFLTGIWPFWTMDLGCIWILLNKEATLLERFIKGTPKRFLNYPYRNTVCIFMFW